MNSTGMTTQRTVPEIAFCKRGSSALAFLRLEKTAGDWRVGSRLNQEPILV